MSSGGGGCDGSAAPGRLSAGRARRAPPGPRLRAAADSLSAPADSTNGVGSGASGASVPRRTVLVLGGDGFCGWPTSLHLSALGYDVIIVDNLSRRKIDVELECESLTPIQSMQQRLATWNALCGSGSGREIRFEYLDVGREYWHLLDLIRREKPSAIVHFAEQRAAPYSMKSSRHKRYTVDNNINGTNNVLTAIVESELDVHLVHLGTMGVYGYGNSGGRIPEGYIDVTMPSGEQKSIPHPFFPGSVYHATKCLDAVLFSFFNRNDGLRITDLHQGIVWGTNTPMTLRDERLINRFDYDSDYGTVLNRFLMQAACDVPLTVYGTGGQTRAFIHISDTARCIALALANPPAAGERVQVFNQVAESHRVRDLAEIVARKANGRVQYISNPRNEASENSLDVSNVNFRSLGYEPITLEENLLDEVVTVAQRYRERVDRDKVMPSSFWNRKRRDACGTSAKPAEQDELQKQAK